MVFSSSGLSKNPGFRFHFENTQHYNVQSISTVLCTIMANGNLQCTSERGHSVPCQLRTIRRLVSRSVLQSLVSSLVLSRLDYGNSTLAGVSSHLLSQLQSVMNAAARLIFSSSRFQHITPLLHQLHWLKAPERIAFKQAVLVYKCLHESAPAYLTDELCQVADVEARQRLRSSSSSSLIVSRTRLLTVSDRAFPRVWNSLPDLVTSTPSIAVFRSRLKIQYLTILPCGCTVPAQLLVAFGHYNRSCILLDLKLVL